MSTPVSSGNVSVSGASVTVQAASSVQGSSWLHGFGVPDSTVGNDGDFYVDQNNYLGFYGPKVQGYWPPARQFGTGNGSVNLNSTTDPSVSNDASQGFGVASIWINNTTHTMYVCTNAAMGAAVWVPVAIVGTTSGTLAAGNDTRIVHALQSTNNLSDVSAPTTALANLGGAPMFFVRNVTANATANFFDVVKAHADAGPITVTLPPAAPPSMVIVIKKVDASINAVTVAVPVGGATIDGALSAVLSTQGATIRLISDGTLWTTI